MSIGVSVIGSWPTAVTDGLKIPAAKLTFAAYGTIAAVVVYEIEDSDFGVSTLVVWPGQKLRFSMEHNSSSIILLPLLFVAMTLGVAASPTRYPDAYMVVFKCDQALAARKEDNASNRSQVLPRILPTSQSNCAALASAFVARFGGKIRAIWCRRPGVRGLNVNGITEAAIAALAKDDRVEFVEPDMDAITQ